MTLTEIYIVEILLGNRLALQTLDAQKFYQKIGYSPCGMVNFTKFKKSKSNIFDRMNQLQQNMSKPDPTTCVTTVGNEKRFWFDKMLTAN
jgi:hypothetical protein